MGRTFCRKCGKPIDFIKTANGKFMPVEPNIVRVYESPDGSMTVLKKNGKTVKAIPAHATDPMSIAAYVPHWTRCTGAEEIKKEQKAEAERWKPKTPAADGMNARLTLFDEIYDG